MEKKSLYQTILQKATSLFSRSNIRRLIFLSFTLSAAVTVLLSGVVFYMRYSDQLTTTMLEENNLLVEQTNQALSAIIKNTNNICKASLDIVRRTDIETGSIDRALNLIYSIDRDIVQSISIFSESGEALFTEPAAILLDVDVTREDWFVNALAGSENFHYSAPRVERLFNDATNTYHWIIPVSYSIEITRGKDTERGVLLIALKYDAIADIFSGLSLSNNGYIYLIDENANIIYHPQQQLIATGVVQENNLVHASYNGDEQHQDSFQNVSRTVVVKSVFYTGWKMIGVIPAGGLTLNIQQNILFFLIFFMICFAVLTIVNSFISNLLTHPIQQLEQSVIAVEKGRRDVKIYTDGMYEIQHLGQSIQRMVDQMHVLTDDVVREHELKRINELNALQAQINPHFLYNTLDIIVWTIENEQSDDAVRLVTALARFFRISLSKGKNIISLSDELEHVLNYLTIQEMRYKDKFRYNVQADEESLSKATIKLVIQPLVENAIYHGMDYMDGEGIIDIRTFVKDSDLFVVVKDNGLGMTPDVIEKLLTSEGPSSSSGSGIGLKNVNERIKLYFGQAYGVSIESEPDEGTEITLHMPAIPYEELEDSSNG